jgi:Winged helix-turn-helix DNA-binding
MASINIPLITIAERKEMHLAARKLHKTTLTNYLRRCLRELRIEARRHYPELFRSSALPDLSELKPVDRTIYRFLTDEGRRTLDELIVEIGLKAGSLKVSLDRLHQAGLIDVIDRGGKNGQGGDCGKRIYVSLGER